MASERLRVAQVEVRGSHFLSEGEVRELLGPAVGENILGLDIDALKARLRSSPWVADATVSRTLPDTLRVEIRERVPLALAEVERLYLMDGDGGAHRHLRAAHRRLRPAHRARPARASTPEARRERAQRAGALLRDLGDLAAEISEVEVEDSGDLRVVLRGAGEVLRMGAAALPRALRSRSWACARSCASAARDAEYFDLRFRDRIYAKQPPAPVAPVATTPATAGARPAVHPRDRAAPRRRPRIAAAIRRRRR